MSSCVPTGLGAGVSGATLMTPSPQTHLMEGKKTTFKQITKLGVTVKTHTPTQGTEAGERLRSVLATG